MQGTWKPDMRRYSKIMEFVLKENSDRYIQAGWELIAVRTELLSPTTATLIYRLGWLRSQGEPVEPDPIPMLQIKQQASFLSKPSEN